MTTAPGQLLADMASSHRLHRVGEHRFVVAPVGTTWLEQAGPTELIVDLIMDTHKAYYIAFLSSLIAHRLTDLHSSMTYVAVPYGTRPRGRQPLALKIVQLSESLWPADFEEEVERFRVMDGMKEFAFRSSIERALIDGLVRPDLCAGFETVAVAWGRALRRSDVDWEKVVRIARGLNSATARRVAFMLNELGVNQLVETCLDGIDTRGANTALDRSNGFELPRDAVKRDPRTGVLINVPHTYLRGWLEAPE